MKAVIALFCFFLIIHPCESQTSPRQDNKTVGITFSFPWINYYRYVDYQKNASNSKFGFFGVGFAAYYKKNDYKISFNGSVTQDLASPIAQIDYSKVGILTNIGTSFFELLYQRPVYKSIYVVGGLNFTNYNFQLLSYIDTVQSFKKTDQTFGLSAGVGYRFDNYFSVAAIYRPAIISFETDGMYRHLITVELRIDLDIRRNKSNKAEE